MRSLLFCVGAWLFASSAGAAEAANAIDVYVTPYYSPRRSAGARPLVAVAKAYDALLAEGDEASLRKVADAIDHESGRITPVTLMVLAIRFYDAGLRDDSVFWFYAAKGRYVTASRVVDFSNSQLSNARDAIVSFATLAGEDINGYAFCNVPMQQAIRAKAVEWVASHPYDVVLNPAIPALPGDRQKNLEMAVSEMRKQAQDETISLKDPAILKALSEACATSHHPMGVAAFPRAADDSTSPLAQKNARDAASLKTKGYTADSLADGSVEITVSINRLLKYLPPA